MRICYLTNSAIPSTVASSIQIVKICEAFSELNNEVILITTNRMMPWRQVTKGSL